MAFESSEVSEAELVFQVRLTCADENLLVVLPEMPVLMVHVHLDVEWVPNGGPVGLAQAFRLEDGPCAGVAMNLRIVD